MKAPKFTDAHNEFIPKQGGDGHPVAEICRKAEISEAASFSWKKTYDGLLPDEMRRMKQLEDEIAKLNKLMADLEQRIKAIAETRMRHGYRNVHVLLQREGWVTNIKRAYRLQRVQSGPAIAEQIPEEKGEGEAEVRPASCFSYRGEDVVMTLERVRKHFGHPRAIRVDQGSAFVSRDLDHWAYAKGVTLDFSRPGKSTEDAFIEAFNREFRSECLSACWFLSLDDAQSTSEDWCRYYNPEGPHSGICQKVSIL